MFGPIDRAALESLLTGPEASLTNLLKTIPNRPNEFQACVAIYAALRLKEDPCQIWQLPAGCGKSRMIATIALILVLTG